jgi:hypothetical protein
MLLLRVVDGAPKSLGDELRDAQSTGFGSFSDFLA